MISIDDRIGSKELIPYFRDFGIKVYPTRLTFGDVAFNGNGPKGETAVVIERKRITDLIDSMQTKRLSGHQLPGLSDSYDFCYLLVEGMWRPGENGELEVHQGAWKQSHSKGLHYRSIDNYLATLELKAGVIYRRTMTVKETVWAIVDLYRWWSKPWAEHKAHEALYAPVETGAPGRRMSLVTRKISMVEKMAAQLPGVDSKAAVVAKRFATVLEMCAATEKDWTGIDGIGKIGARKIMEALGK
jgi:ERCC4-type nuclease